MMLVTPFQRRIVTSDPNLLIDLRLTSFASFRKPSRQSRRPHVTMIASSPAKPRRRAEARQSGLSYSRPVRLASLGAPADALACRPPSPLCMRVRMRFTRTRTGVTLV